MKIIDEIFDDISFKIGPEKNIRKEYLYRIIKRFYKLAGLEKNFIFKNLIIPNDKLDHELKNALLNIKAMASFANGYIINRICKNLKDDQIYVNIGVWKGFSLIAGMVNTNCHVDGIDNFSEFKETNPKEEFLTNFNKYKNTTKHKFYEMDYKIYLKEFESRKVPINFYFYDGAHYYKDQLENLEIAHNFFSKDTIILIDDFNGEQVEQATMDFISKYPNQFKILKQNKTKNLNHPSFWNGNMIFQRV